VCDLQAKEFLRQCSTLPLISQPALRRLSRAFHRFARQLAGLRAFQLRSQPCQVILWKGEIQSGRSWATHQRRLGKIAAAGPTRKPALQLQTNLRNLAQSGILNRLGKADTGSAGKQPCEGISESRVDAAQGGGEEDAAFSLPPDCMNAGAGLPQLQQAPRPAPQRGLLNSGSDVPMSHHRPPTGNAALFFVQVSTAAVTVLRLNSHPTALPHAAVR